MDFGLRRGLFISFIFAGVAFMIGTSQYIGMAILAVAVIWWFLFLYPKSPVKKHWWSIPEELMIKTLQIPGYKTVVRSDCISVWIDLTSRSPIMVDRIVVKIGRKSITSSEWKSHEVVAHEHKFQDFKRPDWLDVGNYEAQLIAYTPEGYSKSRKFVLEVKA